MGNNRKVFVNLPVMRSTLKKVLHNNLIYSYNMKMNMKQALAKYGLSVKRVTAMFALALVFMTVYAEGGTGIKLACAKTVFSQPGVRFMQKIRCTDPYAAVTVTGLPKGLYWNGKRKIVEGVVKKEGRYSYQVHISADGGSSSETVCLTVSKNLPLPVPFMGWISWNAVQGCSR